MRIWPFRHFGLKLLSVALAVLLWMVVSGEETVERGLRDPLGLRRVRQLGRGDALQIQLMNGHKSSVRCRQ